MNNSFRPEKETYMMMKLASGELTKEELVQWLEKNVASIKTI